MITLVKDDQYFLVFDSVVSFFVFFFFVLFFVFFVFFFCRLWREVLLCQNPLFIDN